MQEESVEAIVACSRTRYYRMRLAVGGLAPARERVCVFSLVEENSLPASFFVY